MIKVSAKLKSILSVSFRIRLLKNIIGITSVIQPFPENDQLKSLLVLSIESEKYINIIKYLKTLDIFEYIEKLEPKTIK